MQAGSKCVQVKGRVAFASLLAPKIPPSKALQKRNVPPGDIGLSKSGWQKKESARKRGGFLGGLEQTDRKNSMNKFSSNRSLNF